MFPEETINGYLSDVKIKYLSFKTLEGQTKSRMTNLTTLKVKTSGLPGGWWSYSTQERKQPL